MNSSIDIAHALPYVLSLIGIGGGVVIVSQLIKKLFGLNSSHVIHLMVVAVSIVAAAAQYVLQLKNVPVEVLGISSASIYGLSQGVYKEAKYVSDFLGKVNAYNSSQNTSAQADAAVAAVTDPAQVATETPAAPVDNGFSA